MSGPHLQRGLFHFLNSGQINPRVGGLEVINLTKNQTFNAPLNPRAA